MEADITDVYNILIEIRDAIRLNNELLSEMGLDEPEDNEDNEDYEDNEGDVAVTKKAKQ